MRFYVLRKAPDKGTTGDMQAVSKWTRPGVKCPMCGATWAEAGVSYPCVDLSNHPQAAKLTQPRAEPIEEFERLRECVRPLLPAGALLPPGTSLGPSVGTAQGEFGAFFFEQPWILLDTASLPHHTDLFRLASFSTVLVGTERFKEAVQGLGLGGIAFHEVLQSDGAR
ncbi:double-CXXCG motif protein [Stigmatella aurantiaca]|uniref:Uncharacterized protein n=1 Tax=Stigmatella aurantiaca (strain DW4/3-1) TaxID=378806 RepID=E3FH33_STIAD|nr:double-CXXCG motif protein [Stigmatella aurantiaca]ADO74063.1 uncharacterized protein STAUR_6306 [Stigmatella aurantiaca DW4/3-1]